MEELCQRQLTNYGYLSIKVRMKCKALLSKWYDLQEIPPFRIFQLQLRCGSINILATAEIVMSKFRINCGLF